ncbi:hypothetical protein [Polaribacter ponticola]|uniref:STAS domain-containing protein n=1 Tax=Polaribacter ponticola TaxID=2978475 RepID=A0ABT5S789_9FLAO|nr:hypothetical protein [Polaribacter sp. MSW5]MDD7913961.1 hypothetical protein [Polaribacter sp. MSW5]
MLLVNLPLNYFLVTLERKLKKEKIVLDINETKLIDKSGLIALKEIIKKGTKNSKDVFIIGNGCKEIYDDISQTEAV